MKPTLAIFGAMLILAGCAQPSAENTTQTPTEGKSQTMAQTSSPSQQMHEMMMQPMKNMNMTGNPDKDFALMMADHHQQGIDMAKVELEHGKNERLKAIAQSIVDIQAKEKEELLKIAEPLKEGGKSEASEQMHMAMMMPMSDMTMANDTDKDFASMMAQHHEMAIKMSEIELKSGTNEQLRTIAQKIIDTQKKEKAELETLAR
jgi:uncharacterized protein (DUF305 family)